MFIIAPQLNNVSAVVEKVFKSPQYKITPLQVKVQNFSLQRVLATKCTYCQCKQLYYWIIINNIEAVP